MTDTADRIVWATENPGRWIDPTDPHYLAEHNLKLVQAGVKSRAAGIKHCTGCREPYIDDQSGLSHCPDCRINHRRRCKGCGRFIDNTTAGDRYCISCTNQSALF